MIGRKKGRQGGSGACGRAGQDIGAGQGNRWQQEGGHHGEARQVDSAKETTLRTSVTPRFSIAPILFPALVRHAVSSVTAMQR